MTLETGVKALAEAVAVDVKALEDGKVDKVAGKGLSESDYTTAEKTKLSGVAVEATKNRADSENADEVHAHTTAQVTGLDTALSGKAATTDPRFTDAREWTAATIPQSEAEAGTASTRRAWTAQRVWQAINAWWQLVTSGFGRNFIAASNEQAARNVLQLGTSATRNVGTDTGQVMEVGAFGLGHTFTSQVFDANEIADQVGKKSGFYPYISDIGSTNIPSTFVYINQLFLGSDLGLTQIAYGINYQSTWIRTRLNNIWSPWAKQLSSDDIGTDIGQVMPVGSFGLGGTPSQYSTVDSLPAGTYFFNGQLGSELDPLGTTVQTLRIQGGTQARFALLQIGTGDPQTSKASSIGYTPFNENGSGGFREIYHTGNLLNIGTTAATARAAMELTGEWVDLRPHLKTGFYWDTTREGKNAHPRIRKLSCGRVELDGIVSFNETSGPTPNGVFVNVPTPFRPQLTAAGLAFADTATPLSFGQCNWIVGGEVAYGGALVHGDVSMIPVGLPPTTQDGALSLSGMYWFT